MGERSWREASHPDRSGEKRPLKLSSPWIEKDHVREMQRKEVVKATYWEARSSDGTLK